MRVVFYTLGCKVNQAEAGGMAALLAQRGHVSVPPGQPADAVIVSTCAVTGSAGQKSRGAIRRMRARYPGAVLCVCGCLSQVEDLSGMENIDIIGGSAHKDELIAKLEAVHARRRSGPFSAEAPAEWPARIPTAFPAVFEPLPDAPAAGRTRVFLKIQDGCERYCSYCVIPSARGHSRSRPTQDVLRAVCEAGAAGFAEIVLTGIEISSFAPSLTELVREVCLAAPGMRVRIGSLTPETVTEDFCQLSPLPNLCPHFHLSVQSGCDEVLRAMNRRYDAAAVRRAVDLLRTYWPNPALGADVIAGFPGESDGQWEETLTFLREARFAALHVFPYSRRKGTPAAVMPGQLTAAQKEARAARAAAIGWETQKEYLDGFVGHTVEVLFETQKEGVWVGHAPQYLPVAAQSERPLQGQIHPVRVTGVREGGWEGVVV